MFAADSNSTDHILDKREKIKTCNNCTLMLCSLSMTERAVAELELTQLYLLSRQQTPVGRILGQTPPPTLPSGPRRVNITPRKQWLLPIQQAGKAKLPVRSPALTDRGCAQSVEQRVKI